MVYNKWFYNSNFLVVRTYFFQLFFALYASHLYLHTSVESQKGQFQKIGQSINVRNYHVKNHLVIGYNI